MNTAAALHIETLGSKAFKALDTVLKQKHEFKKTMEGFDPDQQKTFLKRFLIDNCIISPVNGRLPVCYIYSSHAAMICFRNMPQAQVLEYIMHRLVINGYLHLYLLPYQKPLQVLIFNDDLDSLPKVTIKKLIADMETEMHVVEQGRHF